MTKYIDPELKYCPKCGDEYMPEALSCAGCNIELLTGVRLIELQEERERMLESRGRDITAGEEVVDVRKGAVFEMKQWQARLQREGIASLLASEDGGCGKKCCGPEVILRVRKSDLGEVARIFSRDHVESTGLKDHDIHHHVDAVFHDEAEETICPACGFTFGTDSTTCPDCGLCFG